MVCTYSALFTRKCVPPKIRISRTTASVVAAAHLVVAKQAKIERSSGYMYARKSRTEWMLNVAQGLFRNNNNFGLYQIVICYSLLLSPSVCRWTGRHPCTYVRGACVRAHACLIGSLFERVHNTHLVGIKFRLFKKSKIKQYSSHGPDIWMMHAYCNGSLYVCMWYYNRSDGCMAW